MPNKRYIIEITLSDVPSNINEVEYMNQRTAGIENILKSSYVGVESINWRSEYISGKNQQYFDNDDSVDNGLAMNYNYGTPINFTNFGYGGNLP